MKARLVYGKRKIPITLIKKNRKTLAITVKPDRTVNVYMPARANKAGVLQKVRKKAKWVFRHLDYFEKHNHNTMPKEYVSGETHDYLGRKYRLRVRKSIYEKVKKTGGFIYLYTGKKGDVDHKKRILYGWYKWQAEKVFADLIWKRAARLKRYKIGLPEFYIKKMKTRWGSCSTKKRRINMNLELIKTPKECVEYIIDHELLHFLRRNHDKEYYRLLEKINPDWRRKKEKLEKYCF